MKIDIKKYPLLLLQDLSDKINWLRQSIKNNSDLIIENKRTENFLEFSTKDLIIDTLFRIDDFKIENDQILYSISCKPSSNTNNDLLTSVIREEHLFLYFENWVDLVRGFKNLDFEDEIEEEYEEEFYSNWKFIDDDADKKPFHLKEQIIILNFLNAANTIIEEEETSEETENIKQDIVYINENISKFSKNQVIKNISKIVAKGFKHSKKLGVELLVELKKYVFKELITNGVQLAIDLINNFNNPLS